MASSYEYDINPFRDIILESILNSDEEMLVNKHKKKFYDIFVYLLQYNLKNFEDIVYLDFDFEEKNGINTIIGNNIITSLWFSGIFPDNPEKVNNSNSFKTETGKFVFNEKTKKLSFKEEILTNK